ncbi:MAG: mechanosensitive ion channel [Deltaproteobacteria bacterium]|nr:MAG: mechanosensitive ion channel [Deltaproteobacteria bacterium]
MNAFVMKWQGVLWLLAAAALGLVACSILFRVTGVFARRTETVLDDSLIRHCRHPLQLILPLLFIHFLFPVTRLPQGVSVLLKQLLGVILIASIAWLVIKLTYVFEDFTLNRFRIDVKDNLQARRINTQIQILKKVVIVTVTIVGLASILMTFEKVRYLGGSLLASAGIAGLIIGLAAQRSIATLLAGIQIAITQPIRIDDVVIVENEWGRIEEITLTYVVVRIWDLRRLILPITYFMEKPFQNWTRVTADILGTVFLYVDYTVPVKVIREELQRILKATDLWDGRVWGLQVTNATDKTLELRALMSASDASNAWNLRCEVREKLIDFVRCNFPEGLPKFRAEIREEHGRETDSSDAP